MKGKTIRLFLVDGTPTGILTAEIMNWSGKVLVAPRSQLSDLARREEVRRTGVYLLIGTDPQFPNRERVYVGEGDNVWSRLTIHDRDASKDFWTRTVLLVSKDENLTKAHARYLESRLIQIIKQADRATLANGTNPEATPLPESDIADMEGFIEQISLILPALGISILQPTPTFTQHSNPEQGDSVPRFVMRDVGAVAHAVEADGQFVVLKGSTARMTGTPSWDAYRALRDQLVSEGKLRPSTNPDYFEFAQDISFDSPSAAATVVVAGNRNGRITWKLENSEETYADWQQKRIETVAGVAPIVE